MAEYKLLFFRLFYEMITWGRASANVQSSGNIVYRSTFCSLKCTASSQADKYSPGLFVWLIN